MRVEDLIAKLQQFDRQDQVIIEYRGYIYQEILDVQKIEAGTIILVTRKMK